MSDFPAMKTYLTYGNTRGGRYIRPHVFYVPRIGWISGIRTWTVSGTYQGGGNRGGPFMSHEDAARHALSACRAEGR